MRLGEIDTTDVERLKTGFEAMDKALGGENPGFGLPSVVQFGGQPGVGKSTLLLQISNALAKRTLYVTNEERIESIAARAKRMNLENINLIRCVATLSPEETKAKIVDSRADFVIVDSLQGMRLDQATGSSRKHTQLVVRDIALDLINFAQKKDVYEDREGHKVTFVMVCHVNKSGDLAGLKEIEHMVDVVAWFGGERSGKKRVFRLEKNRMGPTSDKATFSMEKDGLHEVDDEEAAEDQSKHDVEELIM